MDAFALSDEHWIAMQHPIPRPTPTSSPMRAVYRPAPPDYVEKFARHVADWRNDVAVLSTLDEKLAHPDFQAIVRIGRSAIPLVIRELKHRPDFLFLALVKLAPEADVVHFRGSPSETVKAWLRWAERNRVSY